MRLKTGNKWQDEPYHDGLVDIGTHRLYASTSGPVRRSNETLVIFITGAGTPCAAYVQLQQRLSEFVRTLFYDRAGYDRSTFPQHDSATGDKIHAEDTARDLSKLLAATQLEPPYVLVAHSYGGIIARSFLEIHEDNPEVIEGMMLLDSATELMFELFPRVPPTELMSVTRNVDWEALTDIKRQSGMTDDEWDYALTARENCREAAKLEDINASAHGLALKYQLDKRALGTRPLSVIRCNMAMDYQMLYDAGVKKGDGTEEERQKAREFIKTFGLFHNQMARAQCRLSESAQYMYFKEWGHDLPIRQPTIVVEEIRKLIARVGDGAAGSKGV